MKRLFTLLSVLMIGHFSNGQTFWTNLNSPTSANYYAIAHDGSKMFGSNGILGSFGQFYYKAGAGSWNTVTVSIDAATSVNNINCLVNGDLLMTGSQSFTLPVVYRSVDNGSNWTQSAATITGFNQNIIQDAAGNVYVYNYSSGSTISKSSDNGATFAVANGSFQVKGLAVTGNTLYACGTNGGWNIWKSTDGALNWTLLPNSASQGNQNNVYATPNGNVYFSDYKSLDGGTTWTQMTAPPSGSGVYMVDALNNIYIKDEPANLFKSSDAGATYTNVVSGLNWSPLISAQRKIATNDGKLYFTTIGASSYSLYVHGAGVPSAIKEKSLGADNITVYPMPAIEELYITLKNEAIEVKNIIITDFLGKEVNRSFIKTGNDLILSVNDLNSGIYLLNVRTSSGSITKKIVVTK